MSSEIRKVSVLIPVYYSEKTIGSLIDNLLETLEPIYSEVEIVTVNDGSKDRSHEELLAAVERHPGKIRYVQLASNFGEHSAVMCGLHHVTGDCVAIIDDDFQNPPEEIVKLVDRLQDGHDVVYSYYEKKQHSLFRNLGSWFNDRVATWLLHKPPGLYLSSFKVMNAFLTRTVIRYEGPFPYLDGIILKVTSNIGTQLCDHNAREEGQSNYTVRKLLHLWLNMFTGFSITPLRIASVIGFGMSIFGVLLAIFFVYARFKGGVIFEQKIPAGWASLIVSVTMFSGVQLCVLGLIGEYLGRLLLTVTGPPVY